jgi:signal transduction histidine kinase
MKVINDFDLKKQAEELGVSVWKTPSFLLIVMGVIIIAAMTAVYFISREYDQPEILLGVESTVVVIILVIGNSIIRQVEGIARLNKLKTEFVSVASHQLRTPLSAIRWETELLLSKFGCGLNGKQCKSIETINTLTTRMTRLVNDLLDVTKIDQGQLILRKEKINIAAVIDEIIEDLLPLVKAKKLHLTFNKKSKKLIAMADREKIKLVIENLLSNSIKYTADRGKIDINLIVREGFLVCGIRDNGMGIPKEQHNQIFSKFFRSDNAAKYQTEGTGLGLYIVKNIIEQSGGRIWFQSIEEVGSDFSFSLPLA